MNQLNHAAEMMGPWDWIVVDGLEFETIIGIHPDERVNPQPLSIDLRLGVGSIVPAAGTDAIDATIDYQRVCERIMAVVNEGRFQLVETLVEQVAADLFRAFPVQRIELRAVKPLALPYTRGVGVMIVRDRPADRAATGSVEGVEPA